MINSISRSFLIAVFLSVGLHSSHAQSNPADEKLEKVNSLLKKNNIDAADKKLISLLEEHSSYGKGWDLLAKIRDHQYEESRKMPDLFSNLSVTVVDSTDNEVKSDSMEINLKKLLSQMSPEKKAYNNYLYTLRQAMLYSENAYYSSIYLRSALRDIEVDSALSTKELTYFKKAEEEFRNKNFNKAAKYYQRALDINPNFYKALLYLGDSYYSMGNYIEAIKNFKICVNRYPMLLEPRKYLVDAYFKEGLFEDALRESINCILVYPDLSIIKRFEYAAFELNMKPSFHWQPREVFPNVMNNDSIALIDLENQPQISVSPHWETYTNAIDRVKPLSNKQGIINEGNEFTTYKYIEVYGWEQMLNESDDESLSVAKRMQNNGYLDCYIFLSRFHDDLYPQYIHFVKNNKERIIKYFNDEVLESL